MLNETNEAAAVVVAAFVAVFEVVVLVVVVVVVVAEVIVMRSPTTNWIFSSASNMKRIPIFCRPTFFFETNFESELIRGGTSLC